MGLLTRIVLGLENTLSYSPPLFSLVSVLEVPSFTLGPVVPN